jgi:thiol-disulfide isomerase/thioredoxin
MKWRAIVVALVVAAGSVQAAPPEVRPLDVQGLRAVRAAHAGKPYVLSLWSVHCEPCIREMALLREMHARHPHVPIVLVAADPPIEAQSITRFLARHDLGPVEAYRYADEFEERIRFAIDPKWRGELPRSYYVDAAGHVEARSGVPERAWLEGWLSRQANGK